ncbi:MAG: N-acetylmuramoyl-L-alanine amidase [Aquabacterium sp.]|nr:N-acetylmuramoyl-L-alanine amidase [Ferruginibacter sp.]
MLAFTFYLLKVTICSGILLGYYSLMLRNKIFHQYNRFYLLASVVLALLLPLVEIPVWHNASQPAPQTIQLLQVVNGSEYLDEIVIVARRSYFSAAQLILLFYCITSLLFLSLFIQALIKIRSLFIKHRHRLVEDFYFVNTTAKGTPFSFLKYIFWNDHIDPDTPTGYQIFKHELAHVRQKHSYDKLFLNATIIFFWCNPFFWLIRKELNMIHEFMADKIAVEDSDTAAFSAMILQATYPQHRFNLTHPFFYSPIKRRIMMLTKNKHSKVGYIGRLLVLPLAVLVFAAFTLKAKTFKLLENYNGKPITVVIDAGHGGDDKGAQSVTGNVAEKDLTLAIVKKIKALNNNANINIVLTRETDIFQSVQQKADFTKAQKADLFISIHIDAAAADSAGLKIGMSTWVSKDNYENSKGSKLFASAIINEFANNYKLPVAPLPMQRQMGVKVLQESPCPSVLIEAGYITNEKDLAYLQTDEAKESIAENVLAAIGRYGLAKQNGIAVNTRTDTIPVTSLKNTDKALIIVDGKPITNDALKKIKPDYIATVNVFKDEAAITAYGDKGKNGVIVVTTKKKANEANGKTVTIRNADSSFKDRQTNGRGGVTITTVGDSIAKPLYVINGKIRAMKIILNHFPQMISKPSMC